jgi:serine/threonine-protein kinase
MASQELVLNGRYRLITQQASGGMAVVYRAQDLQLQRTVAVKVLRPSLTDTPEFLQKFKQEATNVANLSHPNIVTVHDFQQDGATLYIVMEWIEGKDLKRIIKEEAPLSIERALNIAIQVCAGIGYAHRSGLVHADVKPQNILVTTADVVKVTDFGIAQAAAETQMLQRQQIVWGSPHYFAPEQAQGEQPTPAADVYAIGIVLFEMLTGKLPFTGTDQQELALAHIKNSVPHVQDYNPRIPINLDKIVYKVMSKNPRDRYADADKLGNILQSYRQQGVEVTLDQPKVSPPPARPGTFSPAAQTYGSGSGNTPPPVPPPNAYPQTPAQPAPATTPPPTFRPAQPQPPVYNTPTPPPPQQYPVYQTPTPPPVTPPQQPQSSNAPANPPVPYEASGLYSINNPSGRPAAYQGNFAQPKPPQQPATPNYQNPAYPAQAPGQPAPYRPAPDYRSTAKASDQSYAPDYSLAPAQSPITTVTVVLGAVAALLLLGLIPLWLAVIAAYAR